VSSDHTFFSSDNSAVWGFSNFHYIDASPHSPLPIRQNSKFTWSLPHSHCLKSLPSLYFSYISHILIYVSLILVDIHFLDEIFTFHNSLSHNLGRAIFLILLYLFLSTTNIKILSTHLSIHLKIIELWALFIFIWFIHKKMQNSKLSLFTWGVAM
jgi:hypothetical protein